MVDVNVPRFNQLCVAVLTGLAFVAGWSPLVAIVAVILAVTRFAGPSFGVFTQTYLKVIKPRWGHGEVEAEPSAAPRFAQLLGAAFLTIASVLFLLGADMAGWVVTLIVTALATLAAATKICVGCMIYERAAG